LGNLVTDVSVARDKLNKVLDSGLAAEHFSHMVTLQGGPSDLLEHPGNYLPEAAVVRDLGASGDGFIEHIDTTAVGMCVVHLGGGRSHVGDDIDHSVGLSAMRDVGDAISAGEPLVRIHAASEAAWQQAADRLSRAIVIGRKTDPLPAVYERVT